MTPLEQAAQALTAAHIDFVRQEPLAAHTSFCIGGPAGLFVRPSNATQLAQVLHICRQSALPCFLLGKGSNVLFSDNGFPGVVVSTAALSAVTVQGGHITAGAGANLAAVCEAACVAGLAGLQFACGIPGSVGGAIYMNAGAFGGEIVNVLEAVEFLDEDGQLRSLPAAQLAMVYRNSVFQSRPWCILGATFRLSPGSPATIRQEMKQIMAQRNAKQPLDKPSAGSAFKRPPGAYAGALIDSCGLRGFQIGGAAISEKHCGFIVNMGGATCADVLALADHVANTVREKTGYVLEKEFRVVG